MNHIAVVEDSAQDRAVLDSYLEKYQQEKNCHFQITHFSYVHCNCHGEKHRQRQR